jgi:cell division septum initiation protein DivIVA
MDFATLATIAISIAVPAVGAFVAYGALRQTVKDQGAEIEELKTSVAKATDAATQVSGLAQAVEHMGQRFADQIKHLVDNMGLNNGHINSQLADIKEELKAFRENRSRRSSPN